MGKIDNIESHAPEFRLHPNLGVSYFTIGIIAACGDFIFIVIYNLISNYIYQLFFYKWKMTIYSALGEGIVVAIIFILLAKSLDL